MRRVPADCRPGRVSDYGGQLDLWRHGLDLLEPRSEAMASKQSYFYRAPDAEDLAAIYAAIAIEIPCPVEAFWGKR